MDISRIINYYGIYTINIHAQMDSKSSKFNDIRKTTGNIKEVQIVQLLSLEIMKIFFMTDAQMRRTIL